VESLLSQEKNAKIRQKIKHVCGGRRQTARRGFPDGAEPPISVLEPAERQTMRNAALILGIIGGLWGMLVGFFSYGYTEVIANYGDIGNLAHQVDNPQLIRTVSLFAPLLAIAGGAMARSRNMIAGVLLLVSAAGMYHAFGFGVFTMFPIAMCGLGGVLALAARQPDAH
jgi:hypothetical protein